ncbi:unnamed protein product [Lactuca virosa]|uniref:Uncharacterized protein n=1 Tax=Lactuca virosa TaxID=75947 RepID=A0AAU9ME07_9ASTR|nr:unnamed protein product [Lactuca virosa]
MVADFFLWLLNGTVIGLIYTCYFLSELTAYTQFFLFQIPPPLNTRRFFSTFVLHLRLYRFGVVTAKASGSRLPHLSLFLFKETDDAFSTASSTCVMLEPTIPSSMKSISQIKFFSLLISTCSTACTPSLVPIDADDTISLPPPPHMAFDCRSFMKTHRAKIDSPGVVDVPPVYRSSNKQDGGEVVRFVSTQFPQTSLRFSRVSMY